MAHAASAVPWPTNAGAALSPAAAFASAAAFTAAAAASATAATLAFAVALLSDAAFTSAAACASAAAFASAVAFTSAAVFASATAFAYAAALLLLLPRASRLSHWPLHASYQAGCLRLVSADSASAGLATSIFISCLLGNFGSSQDAVPVLAPERRSFLSPVK